jgi:hypothetical protein
LAGTTGYGDLAGASRVQSGVAKKQSEMSNEQAILEREAAIANYLLAVNRQDRIIKEYSQKLKAFYKCSNVQWGAWVATVSGASRGLSNCRFGIVD